MNDKAAPRCLGLIGGLGVGATVHYYEQLVKAHAARGCVPNIVMVHADMSRVLKDAGAGDTVHLADYLAQLISRMALAGAEVAAIPAVTPHICARELVNLSPLPLVNLVEAIAREIQSRGFRRVALFGTRFTIESKMFGQLSGVDVVLPQQKEIDFIHETYLQIANSGRGSDGAFQGLRRVAVRLCERDQADGIILAGTDLSTVFNEANTDFPHIDGARVHMNAIMRELLN
jgi:aspartate racemase